MQAAQLGGDGMILFSEVPITGAIRAELEGNLGAVILDDVLLPEVPERGGFLCVAVDDPKRFVITDRKDQAAALGCVVVGKPYSVIRSEKEWTRYLTGRKKFLASRTQEDDNITDEVWDSIMANLSRGRTDP